MNILPKKITTLGRVLLITTALYAPLFASAENMPYVNIDARASGSWASKLDVFTFESQVCADNNQIPTIHLWAQSKTSAFDLDFTGYDSGKPASLFTINPPIKAARSGDEITLLKLRVGLCDDGSYPAVTIRVKDEPGIAAIVFGNPSIQVAPDLTPSGKACKDAGSPLQVADCKDGYDGAIAGKTLEDTCTNPSDGSISLACTDGFRKGDAVLASLASEAAAGWVNINNTGNNVKNLYPKMLTSSADNTFIFESQRCPDTKRIPRIDVAVIYKSPSFGYQLAEFGDLDNGAVKLIFPVPQLTTKVHGDLLRVDYIKVGSCNTDAYFTPKDEIRPAVRITFKGVRTIYGKVLTADSTASSTITRGPAANFGNVTGKGIVPNCDPSLPPSAVKGTPIPKTGGVYAADGCGINKLVELFQNIMKYLLLIAIPIAVLAIGYGGFQIMTSAGSEEKLSAGKNAMQLAVIGIVIMLASYFIVQAIFLALGVDSAYKPGGL